MSRSTLEQAREYLAAGLAPIPILADGSKRPALTSWKPFCEVAPTEEELELHFGGLRRGIATVCGCVSGGLEVLDFDRAGFFDAWSERVERLAPGLLARLPVVRTPKGYGRHVFLRSVACEGNQVLARECDPASGRAVVAIETRGEGGYVLLPGSPSSCHPTGNLYEHLAGPSLVNVPVLTRAERAVLLDAARALDAAGVPRGETRPSGPEADRAATQTSRTSQSTDHEHQGRRPGDDFSRRATSLEIVEMLVAHGWSVASERDDGACHVTRPGKRVSEGHSGTVGHCRSRDGCVLFHNFSGNAAPFAPNRSYNAFGVLALLEYEGDWSRCASDLVRDGYGEASWGGEGLVDIEIEELRRHARVEGGGEAHGETPGEGKHEEDELDSRDERDHVFDAAFDEVSDDTTDDADDARSTEAVDTERSTRHPVAFPDELLEVPGFLGELMRHNLETAYLEQPVLALASALTVLATLTARKIATPEGLRTNLYVLGVCESGEGKEHARQVAKQLFAQAGLEQLLGPEDFASATGLENAVEAEPAILFQLDEVGRMLRTTTDVRTVYLYQIPSVLMKLYSSASSEYRSRAYADRKLNKTIVEPCASLYGTTVPQSLYESLTTEALTDGLVARMLIFEVDEAFDPQPRQVAKRPVPASLVAQARAWGEFRRSSTNPAVRPEPRVLRYSPESLEAIVEFAARMRTEKRRASPSHRAVWNRAAEHARKLATLQAVSRYGVAVDEVSLEAVRWGTRVAEHIVRRMLSVAQDLVGANEWEGVKKRVLLMVRDAGPEGIGLSALTRKTQFLRARDRRELLDDLATAGRLRRTQIGAGRRQKLVLVASEFVGRRQSA